MKPLEITAYTPADGYNENPDEIEISITFSGIPLLITAEESFILERDENAQQGHFSWDGSTLYFDPVQPFAVGHDYTVSISTEVEDEWGNSLEEDFYLSFTTKADTEKPQVNECIPSDEETITDNRATIDITFSEEVDRGSFYNSFMLSPTVRGYFNWVTDSQVQFIPLNNYLWNTEYKITIHNSEGSGLLDLQGNLLDEEFTSTFTVTIDEDPPEIESVRYVYDDTTVPQNVTMTAWDPETAAVILNNVDRRGSFIITFADDSEIDVDSAESACSVEPVLTPEFEWISDYELKIEFDPDKVNWDTIYKLQISEGISDEYNNETEDEYTYYYNANAETSKPPEVASCFLWAPDPVVPGTGSYQAIVAEGALVLTDFDNVTGSEGFFDYVFNLGDIDVPVGLSPLIYKTVLKAFGFTITNDCCKIDSPFKIEVFSVDDQTAGSIEPAPYVPLAENQVLVRLHCNIISHPTNSGYVTFRVYDGIKDVTGNIMTEEYSVTMDNN